MTEAKTKLTSYQRRLVFFLSVATFFEGYDFIALVQVLPRIVEDMAIDEGRTGLMVSVINIGAILSFWVIRLADRKGRRPVLALTIAGYTITSLLTGLMGNPWAFAGVQLLGRVFLLGEVAVSMVYAAEEIPSHHRGRVIGLLQAVTTLGTIFCAGITPALLGTELGWRAVYFVGAIPLVLVAFARRGLKETRRFEERERSAEGEKSLIRIVRGPYRRRVFLMASIWGLTYLCAQVLITFWNLYAVQSLGLTLEEVAKCVMIAAIGSTPLVFGVGRLLEMGRRRAATVVYALLILGTLGCYNFESIPLLTASLLLSVFAVTGVLPILNAYTTELFPTDMRADAFAWSNSLLGRLGYVISPVLVGWAAGHVGYGPAVSMTVVFPFLALVLILTRLPETAGVDLEVTSRLEGDAVPAGAVD